MSFDRRRPRWLTLATVTALAILASSLAACTSSAPANQSEDISAGTLFRQLRASSASAKSVRIKGSISRAAANKKPSTAQIDIAGDRAGKNSRVLANDGTGAIDIVTAGGKSYLKADSAYWTKNGSASIAKVAAGRYLELPGAATLGLSNFTIGKLLDQVQATSISTAGKLRTAVTRAELNGVPAYVMTNKDDNTKIYVSTDGQAHLLRIVGGKSQPTTLDFTQWNAVPPTSAPPPAQVARVPGL